MEAELATAAEVVRTLLIRSGNIELNPGPTGRFPDLDYDTVDNSQILGEEDMTSIMEELMPVKTRYKTFGIILGLSYTELEAIQRGNMPYLEEALTMVVIAWLRQKYNVIKFGPPTWRRIVEAIDHEAGGNNHSLAKQIAKRHPVLDSSKEKCECLSVPEKSTPPTSLSTTYVHDISGKISQPASCSPRHLPVSSASLHLPSSTLSSDEFVLQAKCHRLLATGYLEQNEDLEEYNWPPVKYNVFVPFTMIRQKSKQHSTVRQRVDSTIAGEETIDYAEFLHDLSSLSGKLVLIEGRPGSGKSTLVLEISKDWANGKILSSKLFFIVRLRMLQGQEKLTLLSLLSTLFEDLSALGLLESICSLITSQSGENVVFALDGFDEYSPRGRDDFIQKLITKKCLPKSTVIITSRPAATQSYRKSASIVIEVIGFTGKQITDYISRHFSDDVEKALSLTSHLQQHNNLMNACYLPLHLNMLVFLYQEDIELPTTETKLYNHVTLSTLLRSIKKRENDESEMVYLDSFNDLSPEDKSLFDKICKLAFNATLSGKQSFTSTELKDKIIGKSKGKGKCQDVLDLVVIDRQVSLRGHTEVYSFFHLTFQEYLASVHISGQDPSQILQLAKKYRNDPAFKLVWKFVCGTLDYSLNEMTLKVILLSEQCKHIMTKYTFAQESEQEQLCYFVISDNIIRPPTKKQLSISDCTTLGYVISKAALVDPTKLIAIDFERTYFNHDGVVALLKQVEHVVLDLRIAGTKIVCPFLEGCSQCPIRGLVKIRIVRGKLGVAEIQKLAEGLKECLNLQLFGLIESNVEVDGLMALGDLFSHWKMLQSINLDHNLFGEKGAEILSRALLSCPTLKSIDLSRNNLGDFGIAFLSEGLSCCKRLEKLSLEKNNINDPGFIALMKGLKCHVSLEDLNVCKNKIGVLGIQALVASSVFKSLKVLNLRENQVGDEGVKLLIEGALSVTDRLNLTSLDIRNNQYGDFEKLTEDISKRTEGIAKLNIQF